MNTRLYVLVDRLVHRIVDRPAVGDLAILRRGRHPHGRRHVISEAPNKSSKLFSFTFAALPALLIAKHLLRQRLITRKEALKELLGHTPVEVFGGLILGILVAYI